MGGERQGKHIDWQCMARVEGEGMLSRILLGLARDLVDIQKVDPTCANFLRTEENNRRRSEDLMRTYGFPVHPDQP